VHPRQPSVSCVRRRKAVLDIGPRPGAVSDRLTSEGPAAIQPPRNAQLKTSRTAPRPPLTLTEDLGRWQRRRQGRGTKRLIPELTRRLSPRRSDCWHIHHEDVQVSTIAERSGAPFDAPQWDWKCGFYPASHRGIEKEGIAATFDQARADFGTRCNLR
jgi:hypothetical protein